MYIGFAQESHHFLLFNMLDSRSLISSVIVPNSQVSSSFFSYEPVLRCLHRLDAVPFAEELVQGQPPKDIDYLPSVDPDTIIATLSLDQSQKEAVKLGLTKRISVIQGPPGISITVLSSFRQITWLERHLTLQYSVVLSKT